MALLGETTRLLIHTQKGSQDSWLAGFRVPYVRIITNEFVMNDEDSLSVFGQDFNLSPDGRALYFSSMAERQQINDNDSIVPVIRIEAGEISVTARALHIAELLFKGFGTDSLLPFGSPDRLKDAQYALDRGKTLLEQVVDQVPAAVSTP